MPAGCAVNPLATAPGELSQQNAEAVRRAFERAGFGPDVLHSFGAIGAPGWKDGARRILAACPDAARVTLARFFVLGDELPHQALERALGTGTVDAMEAAGLAVRGTTGWRCPFNLAIARGVTAFGDAIGDPVTLDLPDDYILPVGSATAIVDDLAVREPCELAVDMGCGQGFLALRSLTHARRCVATDINARALAFSRTNASLAGVSEQVETRLGSFFEPIGDLGGRVGLFTCNPPFIIQPGSHVTATANPMEGDAMLEHIVRRVPGTLADGGWATVIGIWEHASPADWLSRIRGWLDGAGCDALVLAFESYRAENYLRVWIQPEDRAAAEPGWRTLCERRGITALTFGGIVMRKRTGGGRAWLRATRTLIDHRTGPASDQLRSFFASQTALEGLGSHAALLDRRLRTAPGWRFDPAHPPPPTPPQGFPPGLALPLTNAAQYAPVLASFDGQAPARQVVTQLHRSGLAPSPDHPNTAGTLHALVTAGCLDIVD